MQDASEDITCKFYDYVKGTIESQVRYNAPWDLDAIVRDWKKWMYDVEWINIYIITNDCVNFDTHTHIGSASDIFKRMKQHNGLMPGGPQDTKRAAGYWNLVFYMRVPPIRNFSCKDIVKNFDTFRGLPSRCENMLTFALETRAPFQISRTLLEKGHKNYSQSIDEMIHKRFDRSKIQELFIKES